MRRQPEWIEVGGIIFPVLTANIDPDAGNNRATVSHI
jgi:hypothetical protein